MNSPLFKTLSLGEISLANRIVMSPLTRCRASGSGRVPNPLMKEYYVQRASAGLIMSEATAISPMGVGYFDTPGIWSPEQIEGWSTITRAVHDAQGKIVLQLWHVGRISDPIFLHGELPVGASSIAAQGQISLVRPKKSFIAPRELTPRELPLLVDTYRRAAENAQKAGFDGVDIHGANGYLLDQFLQDSTNHRTDDHGGSIENRARLMLEVTDAIVSVWGAGRVGMHLAPRCDSHDMGDSNPAALFEYVGRELGQRKLAFICTREMLGEGQSNRRISPIIKKAFGGAYIANEGYTQETAEKAIAAGDAEAVAFGKLFIANPDLPERFRQKAALNVPAPDTFYASSAGGYTDYPKLGNSIG